MEFEDIQSIESCLRMKVLVLQCGHQLELHPALPQRIPYKPPEKPDRLPGRRPSHSWSCERGDVYPSGCPLTGPVNGQTQGVDWPSILSPQLLTLSPLFMLTVTEWTISSLFPWVWPKTERHNCHMCPIYQPQWPSGLIFIMPEEWRDDSWVAELGTCLGVSSPLLLFSCYP